MKKSLSAIFCLVIMLSLSVPVSASAFDSSNYASSNSSAVAQSQYEMLMDSFGFDSSLSDICFSNDICHSTFRLLVFASLLIIVFLGVCV